ncbi:hypothetical protein BC332_04507 [Capsicum chinense]|nr:hypothetical protein BC332_04507 [Capsicum chinense]
MALTKGTWSSLLNPCVHMSTAGGTAFNGVVEELKKLTTRVAHVLPVSDDGGSTAEIVRVLGGPAVGDIRSRCLRLSDQSTSEARAVRILLGHRLPLDSPRAKSEWYEIVEGSHELWQGVSKPYRETIRAFLAYFQDQILRRSDESFCFSNGSIGNFFFAGARIFFQSLDAAIFLFSRVSDIPAESFVLPVISTNERLTLGCELWDGTVIRGQNEISHPTHGSMQPIDKDASSAPALPSRIKRVFYMSSEGSNLLHEVFPTVNPTILEQLRSVDCIVFGMGSLFTSICPSLVLLGVGETISLRSCPKVLLLNGTHDRETSGFSASCFVTAITDALNRTYGDHHNCLTNPGSWLGWHKYAEIEPEISSPQPTVDHNATSTILSLLDTMSRDLARANAGLEKTGSYVVTMSESLNRMEIRRNSRTFTPDTLLIMNNPPRPLPNAASQAPNSPQNRDITRPISLQFDQVQQGLGRQMPTLKSNSPIQDPLNQRHQLSPIQIPFVQAPQPKLRFTKQTLLTEAPCYQNQYVHVEENDRKEHEGYRVYENVFMMVGDLNWIRLKVNLKIERRPRFKMKMSAEMCCY